MICSELTMRQATMLRLSSVGERILHRADKTDSQGDVSKRRGHGTVHGSPLLAARAASMSRAKDCPFTPGPGSGLSIRIQDSPKRYGHWLRSSEIQMQWRWGFLEFLSLCVAGDTVAPRAILEVIKTGRHRAEPGLERSTSNCIRRNRLV